MRSNLPADEFGDMILPRFAKTRPACMRWALTLIVTTQLEIEEIGSPSHAVRVRQAGNRASRITLASGSRPAQTAIWCSTRGLKR